MSGTVKSYRSYAEQIDLLIGRGMDVGDRADAEAILRRVNYYRLSGYWYPFRRQVDGERADQFYSGTRLADVIALYDFDTRLRSVTFVALTPIELAIRAALGHELGRVDPCAHLDPSKLGPTARSGDRYQSWLTDYRKKLGRSREDFVVHHSRKYGGQLPVWAAVEVLDWGGLTRLYGLSPLLVQQAVADRCGLSGPQLSSWLQALNQVRNTCAHHGRLFNRVHALQPKLPTPGRHPDLNSATTRWARTFGQLTLIQFLLDRLAVGQKRLLPAALASYPQVAAVPLSHVGAPAEWDQNSPLWAPGQSTGSMRPRSGTASEVNRGARAAANTSTS